MTELESLGARAKAASYKLTQATEQEKNGALALISRALRDSADEILAANALDLDAARSGGMGKAMLDRLTLTEKRIGDIADSVLGVASLPDPVGRILEDYTRPNGLHIRKVSVPLGVVGIIYEARPNVTVDAAVLCLKSGNAVILRGGKEAINSNKATVGVLRRALEEAGLDPDCVLLVEDTSRASSLELMNLTEYVDVLIPRGGAGLIRAVSREARVPVIRTGEGICHIYVDETADFDMAARVLLNAKCSRPSVCNAVECLLVQKSAAEEFLNIALPQLLEKGVQVRGDAKIQNIFGTLVKEATDEDWDTEYDDYILAVKTVRNLDEAIDFINLHGTSHSEAIMTSSPENAQTFLRRVDAAAVYVNASTRFTDGGEFGMGAEMGISTQKLHARGPMGLREMTSYKYVVTGDGQTR
ncbi:MAG: glutamate-5-semialdehyde dehydrogenase [Oscillospiraceae bacterium]|nr:glutamate-5-semialdehyde dehydrogenase [Oscillospiraceae bacterium]